MIFTEKLYSFFSLSYKLRAQLTHSLDKIIERQLQHIGYILIHPMFLPSSIFYIVTTSTVVNYMVNAEICVWIESW